MFLNERLLALSAREVSRFVRSVTVANQHGGNSPIRFAKRPLHSFLGSAILFLLTSVVNANERGTGIPGMWVPIFCPFFVTSRQGGGRGDGSSCTTAMKLNDLSKSFFQEIINNNEIK